MTRALLAVALLAASVLPAAAQHGPGRKDDRYDPLFRKYSKRYFGVAYDWRVFKAQAIAESNLSPDATSRVGARGLMQLMPATFREVQSKNPEFQAIDHPEWNIAAGICYDRKLWRLWDDPATLEDRRSFMFGSYNAGRGTLLRAQQTAREKSLDPCTWRSIEQVAPAVRGWRHRETLEYVEKIDAYLESLKGRSPPGESSSAPAP
ncbi:MAG TPA: transglycosylase SLT domain-containing protein [Candidatus Polarisedimenticolaceae bacterium]